jgi:hypothetical protein
MKPALVALDLDDTLLDPNLDIPPVNQAAVRRVLDDGVPVILASGRTIDSMRRYARILDMEGRNLPIICVNGAEVRDVDSDEILRRIALTPHACRIALAVLDDLGLAAQAYEDGIIIVSRMNEYSAEDRRLTGMDIRLADGTAELAALPRSKLIATGEPAYLASILEQARRRLTGIATVLISKPSFLEILPPGADKAVALAWVAERLKVPRERVMAMGDAGNDLGMISWAGFGCTPADAQPEARAIARYIATRNHDDGAVAELLDRLLPPTEA